MRSTPNRDPIPAPITFLPASRIQMMLLVAQLYRTLYVSPEISFLHDRLFMLFWQVAGERSAILICTEWQALLATQLKTPGTCNGRNCCDGVPLAARLASLLPHSTSPTQQLAARFALGSVPQC